MLVTSFDGSPFPSVWNKSSGIGIHGIKRGSYDLWEAVGWPFENLIHCSS